MLKSSTQKKMKNVGINSAKRESIDDRFSLLSLQALVGTLRFIAADCFFAF